MITSTYSFRYRNVYLSKILALLLMSTFALAVSIPVEDALTTRIPTLAGDGFSVAVFKDAGGSTPSPSQIEGRAANARFISPTIDFPSYASSISTGSSMYDFFRDTVVAPDSIATRNAGYFMLRNQSALVITESLDLNMDTPAIDIQLAVGSDDGFYLVVGNQFVGSAGDRGFSWSYYDIAFDAPGVYPIYLLYYGNTSGSSGLEFKWNTALTGGYAFIDPVYSFSLLDQSLVDDAPIIHQTPDRIISVNQVYAESTRLSQFSGDEVFTLVEAPAGATLDPATGVVYWQNPVEAVAPYNFTIRATGDYGSDEMSWRVFAGGDLTGLETIGENDTTYDGRNLVIKGQTIVIEGEHDFNAIGILSDEFDVPGIIIVRNGATEVSRLNITYDLIVESGCQVSADGQGYAGGQGPGSGSAASPGQVAANGGSYGGIGGTDRYAASTYGSAFYPNHKGSGGGAFDDQVGGTGGGIVRIIADTVVLDGQISANGLTGSGSLAGGGSGGSIWIETAVLSGSGVFHADGAAAGHGGGGGRIAIYYAEGDDFDGFADSSADGGRGIRHGQEGTVGFFNTGGTEPALDVYHRFVCEDSVAVTSFVADWVVVHDGASLELKQVTELTVAEFIIAQNGLVTVNGMGYQAGGGPGGGTGNFNGAGGGGHGGIGGRSLTSAAGGPRYGSFLQPITPGSGGGNAGGNGEGGRGGGAIHIIADMVQLDGMMQADGFVGYR